MKLYIDSTKENSTILTIFDESDNVVANEEVPDEINKSLLPQIASFVKKQKDLSWQDIKSIKVNEGPGTRFTRTRLSVAYANALAFALGTKVNDKEWTAPIYSSEPNITKPKHG